METLPPLVGARTLQQESDRLSHRAYMPFVGTAPVMNRDTSETEKRGVDYVFPGFCSGCQRGLGLCYGCDRDPYKPQ